MELQHPIGLWEKGSLNTVQKMRELYECQRIESPVGLITLIASAEALVSLRWGQGVLDRVDSMGAISQSSANGILRRTAEQLREYFCGKRHAFDIPLDPQGTDFQKQVWQQLLKIPYGQTISYGEQAQRLGRPQAARAVGAANGKNPIGIIIPCHRVIGASGHLTGFAGGLEVKRQLLDLEGISLFK